MKQDLGNILYCGQPLPAEEAELIRGGGFSDTMHCITGTLLHGFKGAAKTLVLGLSIWGMARMAGVAAECSGL